MRSESDFVSRGASGTTRGALRRGAVAIGLCLAATAPAHAMNVYIMSSGDATWDAALQTLLASHGHTSTIGPRFWEFDGTDSLAGVDAIFMSGHAASVDELLTAMGGFVPGNVSTYASYSPTPLQASGHNVLRNWVETGGGLVTTGTKEFTASLPALNGAPTGYPGAFGTLESVFPTELLSVIDVSLAPTTAYEQQTVDPVLNAGVAELFFFASDSADGVTEYQLIPRAGASTFYSTHAIGTGGGEFMHGLVGWSAGAGRVCSFSIEPGPLAMADPNASRLLVNALVWAAAGGDICPCELTGDTMLDVFDLLAYLDQWFTMDPAADLDGTPGVDVFDLLDYLDCWFAGC